MKRKIDVEKKQPFEPKKKAKYQTWCKRYNILTGADNDAYFESPPSRIFWVYMHVEEEGKKYVEQEHDGVWCPVCHMMEVDDAWWRRESDEEETAVLREMKLRVDRYYELKERKGSSLSMGELEELLWLQRYGRVETHDPFMRRISIRSV